MKLLVWKNSRNGFVFSWILWTFAAKKNFKAKPDETFFSHETQNSDNEKTFHDIYVPNSVNVDNIVLSCSCFLLYLQFTIKTIITCGASRSLFFLFSLSLFFLFSLELVIELFTVRDELLKALKFLFKTNNRGKFSLNLLSHLLFDSLIKAEITRPCADLPFCLYANYFHFSFHRYLKFSFKRAVDCKCVERRW